MNDRLVYHDFAGLVHFSSEYEVFYGKIEGISDLVIFEGASEGELKLAFLEAAEDYITICKYIRKEAFRTFKALILVKIQNYIPKHLSARR